MQIIIKEMHKSGTAVVVTFIGTIFNHIIYRVHTTDPASL